MYIKVIQREACLKACHQRASSEGFDILLRFRSSYSDSLLSFLMICHDKTLWKVIKAMFDILALITSCSYYIS